MITTTHHLSLISTLLFVLSIVPLFAGGDDFPMAFDRPTRHLSNLQPVHKTLIYYYPSDPKLAPVIYLGFFTILSRGPNFISFCKTFHPHEQFYLAGNYVAQPFYDQNQVGVPGSSGFPYYLRH